MSKPLKLVNAKLSPYGHRVEMVLLEKNISYQKEIVDLANRPDWFVQEAPFGKVPLLYIDGKVLFESIAICEFLEDNFPQNPLHVKDAYTKNSHRAWIQFANDLTLASLNIIFAQDEQSLETKKTDVACKLAVLEKYLNPKPYFAGDDFLLIDIALTSALSPLTFLNKKFNFGLIEKNKNVATYANTVMMRPSLKKVLPDDFEKIFNGFLERRNSYLLKL